MIDCKQHLVVLYLTGVFGLLLHINFAQTASNGSSAKLQEKALASIVDTSFKSAERIVIKVAVLLPYSDTFLFSYGKVKPSIALAEKYLATRGITSGFSIKFLYGNSNCSPKNGPLRAFDFRRKEHVNCFIGPVCDYSLAPVSRYAPYWNIPVVSPGGLSHSFAVSKLADFPFLTRVGVTFNSMSLGFMKFMNHFKWKKMKVLYDKEGNINNHRMENFCILSASAIIYTANISNVLASYFPLLGVQNRMADVLRDEVGSEFGGKLRNFPLSNVHFFTKIVCFFLLFLLLLRVCFFPSCHLS